MKDHLPEDPMEPNPSGTPWNPAQCAFAMGKLCHRLILQGYIAAERTKELSERATNLERGHGFLTDSEREARADTEDLLS